MSSSNTQDVSQSTDLASASVGGRVVRDSAWGDNIETDEEDLIVQMTAIDFLKSGKSFEEIKAAFSVSGYQKSLLKFLREYENPSLDKSVKLQMQNQIDGFQFNIMQHYNEGGKNNEFDWVSCALGLGTEIRSQGKKEQSRIVFYAAKFCRNLVIQRFPVPKISDKIAELVPQTHKFETVVTAESQTGRPYPRKFQKPCEPVNVFFVFMTTMFLALKKGRTHEVLAVIAHLLCNDEYNSDVFIRWNYLHVWGVVAVVLAKMQKPKHVVTTCLNQMAKLKKFESDKIDCWYYRQQVAMHYGENKMEQSYLDLIHSTVPSMSTFYSQSALVHILAKRRQIEDIMAAAYCHSAIRNVKSKYWIGRGLKKIFSFELFLHKICSRPMINLKCKQKILVTFPILELYKITLQNMSLSSNTRKRKRLESVEKSLTEQDHHLSIFMRLYCDNDNDFTKSDYRQKMSEIEDTVKDMTRKTAAENWANILFVHFILLKR